MTDTDDNGGDICRVCRMEGSSDRPLYHPCICTGSIKFIHQECLTQWLKYSKKEYCELCNYKYTFMPIYHPDMPKRLPVKDLVTGLVRNLGRALRYWVHYTAVAVAWLGVVPLTACRIYRCLFTGSVNSILTLPLDMLSTENLLIDCLQGGLILAVTLCTFISLIWLREQIVQGGLPNWFEQNNNNHNEQQNHDAGGVPNNVDPPDPVPPGADPAAPNIQNDADALIQDLLADPGEDPNGVDPDENGDASGDEEDPDESGSDVDDIEIEGPDGIVDNIVEPPEPVEGGEGAGGENGNGAAAEDANWQPFEWNQAADELTWERLLGLDGSLVFIEHVFWVISLNTLFILVFGFSPYHIGQMAVSTFKLQSYITSTYFEGLSTILVGYFVIAAVLFMAHKLFRSVQLRRTAKFMGMCYLVIKVFLLVLMEIGVFPALCGFWLDVCSLNLFNSTLKDRIDGFHSAPTTSLFLHWLVGMVYVFYFASFVLLLREVLRPGVLWFLRNLNDPDFNPIQEMIQLPVYRHLRRFGASLVMFGVTITLIVFIPIQLVVRFWPTVLPYNISLSVEAPLSELSLELLLLQVVLPALLEQGHARQALKSLTRRWCVVVGRLLDLTAYLLPAEDPQRRDRNHNVVNVVPDENGNDLPAGPEPPGPPGQEGAAGADPVPPGGEAPQAVVAPAPVVVGQRHNLAAEHQAAILGLPGPGTEQPYQKPNYFPLKIVCLLVALGASFLVVSLMVITVPVTLGRELISLFLGRNPIHELYTMAAGLYLTWVCLRLWIAAADWLPDDWEAARATFRAWAVVVRRLVHNLMHSFLKCCMVGFALVGVIPLCLGLLFQLVVITPMRVPVNQSPMYFLWQDWAMGILHCKIICAVVMMGPDWWLKQVFERVYQDGLRNMNVGFIYMQLVVPVMSLLGSIIAIPYAFAYTAVPALGGDLMDQILFQRHVYPCLLILTLVAAFIYWQIRHFSRLIQHIRNDKYLVGQRLVNYERAREEARQNAAAAQAAIAAAAALNQAVEVGGEVEEI